MRNLWALFATSVVLGLFISAGLAHLLPGIWAEVGRILRGEA